MYDQNAARIKDIASVFLEVFDVFLNRVSLILGTHSILLQVHDMYCSIYKSIKKELTYLYVKDKGNFKDVPASLLEVFGPPQFLMVIQLDKREKLAGANIEKVKDSLKTQGYFLQMPPLLDDDLKHIRDKNTKL